MGLCRAAENRDLLHRLFIRLSKTLQKWVYKIEAWFQGYVKTQHNKLEACSITVWGSIICLSMCKSLLPADHSQHAVYQGSMFLTLYSFPETSLCEEKLFFFSQSFYAALLLLLSLRIGLALYRSTISVRNLKLGHYTINKITFDSSTYCMQHIYF